MSHGNGHFWVSGPLKSIVKHRIWGLGKRVSSLNCAKMGGLILTTYTSYDVFLHKDVPFWSVVDNAVHLGVTFSQNTHFGIVSLNWHFRAKLAKY